MMTDESEGLDWQAKLDTIVSVGGVEKRLGDCTRADLNQLARNARAEATRLQSEADVLKRELARRSAPSSKAHVDRVRSMAKMTGQRLSKRGDRWVLVASGQDPTSAFARGEGRSFKDIEDELFGLLEARGEIPGWLTSQHSTWLAARDRRGPVA
jgi:hypothetical protein